MQNRVLYSVNWYNTQKEQLKGIVDELASPLGTYYLKSLKRRVNDYYKKLPSARVTYGDKVDVSRLGKLVAEARGKIDSAISQLHSENIAAIEKRLGTKMSKPMTHQQADNKHPNVGYRNKKDEFGVNCQCCVVAYELRRRGYDVTAMPNLRTGFPHFLSKDTTKIWENPYRKRVHPKEIYYPSNKPKTGKEIREYVETFIKEDGRYHFSVAWNAKEGHIVTIERKKGNIVWYDPQVNKILGDDFLAPADIRHSMRLYKVDNLLVVDKYIDMVVRKIRSV